MNLKLSLDGTYQEVNTFVERVKFLFHLPVYIRPKLSISREKKRVEYEFVDVEVPVYKQQKNKTIFLKLMDGNTIELVLSDVEQFNLSDQCTVIIGKSPFLPEPISLSRPSSPEEIEWKQ
ncbi:hypothetical protein MK805_04550 [Shimazuella sp. AN120528]|uniref:hypothetical protein n=1 Tax=Shimazuella soli TaxID=1892854 RepID=UPI001F0D853F|nr:hypothetical protein [Shimazuella soli]MCH5584237.1 hypothetical protein [Shimazuella soli]